MLASALAWMNAVQVVPAAAETPVLTLEKTIRIGDAPSTVVWSPDNRHVAVLGFTSGKLYLYNTDASGGGERITAERIGPGSPLAFSPDSRTLVVRQQTQGSAFRFIDVSQGREAARRDLPLSPYEGCRLSDLPLAFTADGGSLWQACVVLPTTEPFLVAVKLRLPDLVVQDRLMSTPPVAGEKARVNSYTLTPVNGRLVLSTIMRSVTNTYESFGMLKQRVFATAFDLDSKEPWFPRFELEEDNRSGFFRTPQRLHVFADRDFALIRMFPNISERPGFPHHPAFDRLLEGYDTRTGRRIVTYGGHDDAALAGGAIAATELLPGGLMIGQWSRANPAGGGLLVFDPRTGVLRQRIDLGRTAPHLALSPDGRRLAHVTFRNDMQIYSVRE